MWKLISIIITGILTSFYFFPFEFTFLPGVNVKMILAVLGVGVLGMQVAKAQKAEIDNEFFMLSILAIGVSLAGFLSITLNNTQDYAYTTYIISMWVWLGAAYMLCFVIREVHGCLSIVLITKYLVAVCVFQCIIALLIDNIPIVKYYVDAFVSQGHNFMDAIKRLYGIGAALDVAGSRFAVVLILLIYILINKANLFDIKEKILFVVAFLIIAVVGNMIARTTTVGLVLSFLYLLYSLWKSTTSKDSWNILRYFVVVLCMLLPLVMFIYHENQLFQQQIRFAFEGFFSLKERGEWSVDSNSTLKSMIVFPETLKTWIIGDGYFESPIGVDPYFIGLAERGFYMGTDVGYLRFIFYFGLLGLFAFSCLILKSGLICIKKFSQYKILFIFLLLVNFIVWFKVSTDIFLVFALFLMISKDENDAYDERLILEI